MNRTIVFLCMGLTVWTLMQCGCGRPYELILDQSSPDGVMEVASCADSDADPSGEEAAEGGADSSGEEAAEEDADKRIYVYVCGAVENPGVCELPEGSRVFEAVDAAGGLTDQADVRYLNLAAAVSDGEQITVFTREEMQERQEAGIDASGSRQAAGNEPSEVFPEESPDSDPSGIVNINTAGREDLMTLNGVGETKADAIIQYREQYGAFQSIEDIMQISGIGQKSFEKLKDHIIV